MNRTSIAWCSHTWNPVTGCTPCSPGCRDCYAKAVTKRFGRSFEVKVHPERFAEPFGLRESAHIFVCSMSDLFHEQVTDRDLKSIFESMGRNARHTFLLLTKRPSRMAAFLETLPWWPSSNIWCGTSVENQDVVTPRVGALESIIGAVGFVSVEPLLGPVSLEAYASGLDWLIVGGQSGGDRGRWLVERCHCQDACQSALPYCSGCNGTGWQPKGEAVEWVRALRDEACEYGVPFFFKGWGGPTQAASGYRLDGREWREVPSTTVAMATAGDAIVPW